MADYECTIDSFGVKCEKWRSEGETHRDGDPAIIYTDSTGFAYHVMYFKHGKLHNDNGPADISYRGVDVYSSVKYYREGKPHRVDGPAEMKWFRFGDCKLETSVWYLNGDYHRTGDNPAIQRWNQKGKLRFQQYWVKGKLHRDAGPAVYSWDKLEYDGGLRKLSYYQHGKLHRIGGPAVRQWHDNGTRSEVQYYCDGIEHRVDGPSHKLWRNDGSISLIEYCVNGEPHRIDGPAHEKFPLIGTGEQKFYIHGYRIISLEQLNSFVDPSLSSPSSPSAPFSTLSVIEEYEEEERIADPKYWDDGSVPLVE